MLRAGSNQLVEPYDAAHDLIGSVAADPAGGWWFSTSTERNQYWVAVLHHVATDMTVSSLAELASSPADAWLSAFDTGFAWLSDSVLLANFNSGVSRGTSVGRFGDGKLVQSVDVADPFLMAAGKTSATIMTREGTAAPGFMQIPFETRHYPN